MNYAAKILHQTAKTCQYVKENYKKMQFFIKRGSLLLACSFFYLSRAVFETKKEQAIDEVKREKELGVFKR